MVLKWKEVLNWRPRGLESQELLYNEKYSKIFITFIHYTDTTLIIYQ